MRLIHLVLAGVALVLAPLTASAAAGATAVRAIAFVASHDRGPTDPQLAPYQETLRANLRFESFHYAGEGSATVSRGGRAVLSIPGGGRIQLEADRAGNVRVHRGGAVVAISPGHPAVFMGGPAGNGGVSGVIVLVE